MIKQLQFKRDKRGNVLSMIIILVFLIAISIVALITTTLSKKATQKFDELGIYEENSSAQIANDKLDTLAPRLADELVFFFYIGLNIGLVVASVKTNFSPIVLIIFIMLLVFAIILAAGFTNIYQQFAQSDSFSEYSQELSLTNIIWSQYTPLIICVLAGITMIIMYGRNNGSAF